MRCKTEKIFHFRAPLPFGELAFIFGWQQSEQPSETPHPPFRSPGRQSCLHIVSMSESFVAQTQPPLVQENVFKAILSALHKTSWVTIGIPNKTAICQPLKVREQRKGTMCHQKTFWKKAQNPSSDSFCFELPPFSKLAFILRFLQKPFLFLLLLVSVLFLHETSWNPFRVVMGWGGSGEMLV